MYDRIGPVEGINSKATRISDQLHDVCNLDLRDTPMLVGNASEITISIVLHRAQRRGTSLTLVGIPLNSVHSERL